MSVEATPETQDGTPETLKAWVTPAVIVSDVRDTEAHVTNFTDGISTGPLHISYGS
ncbi:MAG: hypothetical protein J7483_07105 [Novosphingobium sp.]|nr:hypothetical protein [Novosphingobium sp.]